MILALQYHTGFARRRKASGSDARHIHVSTNQGIRHRAAESCQTPSFINAAPNHPPRMRRAKASFDRGRRCWIKASTTLDVLKKNGSVVDEARTVPWYRCRKLTFYISLKSLSMVEPTYQEACTPFYGQSLRAAKKSFCVQQWPFFLSSFFESFQPRSFCRLTTFLSQITLVIEIRLFSVFTGLPLIPESI